MTTVEGTKITHTHGDTLLLTFPLYNADGTAYTVQDGDVLTFLLRRNRGGAPVITKTIPTDTFLLTLTADETAALGYGTLNGHYVYDVKLETFAGVVDTVINLGEMYITDGVDA